MPSAPGRWLVSGLAVVTVGGMALTGSAAARHAAPATGCPHPSVPVPRHEPKYTVGPTELVSGLYMQGGAVPPPPCHPKPRGPYAGKLIVSTSDGGQVVARRKVANGHLARISLAPGTYALQGRMTHGPELGPVSVTVRSGRRVRQDLFEDVP